jgi:hypothetical protein
MHTSSLKHPRYPCPFSKHLKHTPRISGGTGRREDPACNCIICSRFRRRHAAFLDNFGYYHTRRSCTSQRYGTGDGGGTVALAEDPAEAEERPSPKTTGRTDETDSGEDDPDPAIAGKGEMTAPTPTSSDGGRDTAARVASGERGREVGTLPTRDDITFKISNISGKKWKQNCGCLQDTRWT